MPVDDQMESRSVGLRRLLAFVGAGVVVCTFALLIWAKLRMVTGVPRTAYAEPQDQKQAEPQQPKEKVQRRTARSASREALHQQEQEAAQKTQAQVEKKPPVETSGGD